MFESCRPDYRKARVLPLKRGLFSFLICRKKSFGSKTRSILDLSDASTDQVLGRRVLHLTIPRMGEASRKI